MAESIEEQRLRRAQRYLDYGKRELGRAEDELDPEFAAPRALTGLGWVVAGILEIALAALEVEL